MTIPEWVEKVSETRIRWHDNNGRVTPQEKRESIAAEYELQLRLGVADTDITLDCRVKRRLYLVTNGVWKEVNGPKFHRPDVPCCPQCGNPHDAKTRATMNEDELRLYPSNTVINWLRNGIIKTATVQDILTQADREQLWEPAPRIRKNGYQNNIIRNTKLTCWTDGRLCG